ncbi:MAG: hypothetical protein KGL13_09100 [Gammaproteobacteria bacterium]|nr:hypothetical protein [Gammaproteobacteria bacterium]MDE2346611.1 hypothetical protein [Gammaproteobacteria bacterium]
MKIQILIFTCLLGLATLGGYALAGNPPAAATHPTAASSDWCAQHQKQCQERMQKNAELCKQQHENCRSLVQLNEPNIKLYCERNPHDARCEKLKQMHEKEKTANSQTSPPPRA